MVDAKQYVYKGQPAQLPPSRKMAEIKPMPTRQRRASKVNWALFAARGALGLIQVARGNLAKAMSDIMPIREQLELFAIREQQDKVLEELRQLDDLLVRHNDSKRIRTKDRIKHGS